MYVCLSVLPNVCIYVCMYVCPYLLMYVCMSVPPNVCMYVCPYLLLYVRMFVRTSYCMYVCLSVPPNVCMYVLPPNVCMYVCLSVPPNVISSVSSDLLKECDVDQPDSDDEQSCHCVCLPAYIQTINTAWYSEQTLLSIEAQLCTRKECKTFRPRRPSSVAMHKVRVRRCPIYIVA